MFGHPANDTAPHRSWRVPYTQRPSRERGVRESTHEVVGVLGEVEICMRWVAKMSRELRAPGRDISAAVKQVSAAMTRIADWERRARALI
ncbi:hypothetical protein SGPA1_50031 [Streptomyces misionensis JCM 4497]